MERSKGIVINSQFALDVNNQKDHHNLNSNAGSSSAAITPAKAATQAPPTQIPVAAKAPTAPPAAAAAAITTTTAAAAAATTTMAAASTTTAPEPPPLNGPVKFRIPDQAKPGAVNTNADFMIPLVFLFFDVEDKFIVQFRKCLTSLCGKTTAQLQFNVIADKSSFDKAVTVIKETCVMNKVGV